MVEIKNVLRQLSIKSQTVDAPPLPHKASRMNKEIQSMSNTDSRTVSNTVEVTNTDNT